MNVRWALIKFGALLLTAAAILGPAAFVAWVFASL